MNTLRKTTKADLLVGMFDTVGKSIRIEKVFKETGIANYNSLKAFCSYIRKAKHIPDENRVDIRIKDDMCTRIV